MKKKSFFLPLAAAIALAGCSSDEPGKQQSQPEVNENGGYIAINIVAPSNMGGRGTSSDPEFADPSDTDPTLVTEAESRVDKAYFFFFDDKGYQTQVPQEVDLKMNKPADPSSTPAVEKISDVVVVVAGGTQPTKLLVILNPHASVIDFAGKTLTEVRSRIADYSYNKNVPVKDVTQPFIMSNSTYYDGAVVEATDITGSVYESKDKAEHSPVQVYVERVIAKVRTNALADDFVKTTDDEGKETSIPVGALGDKAHTETDVVIKPVIEGIEIANIAKSSYLFKNVDNEDGRISDWIAKWSDVNDKGNKRSYWANSTPSLSVENQSWTNIGSVKPNAAHVFYIQENTVGGKKSAVLLTATIMKKTGEDTWEPFDFVKYAGNYYEKDGFLTQYETILKNAGFAIRKPSTDESGSIAITIEPIRADRLEWISNRTSTKSEDKLLGYELTAHVKDTSLGDKWELGRYDAEGRFSSLDAAGNKYDWDDVDAELMKKANRVWYWNQGKCYYFAEIEHFGPADSMFATGVVRNHIYDLNLNSLSGLGTPVADPEEIIIPEKPTEDLFYLDAQVNILKWRVVKQTVDFKD